MALPLEGIRIADLSVVWAGPYAAALLGDMGAEVIRVESIQRWDRNARNSNITADQLRANGGTPAADAQMWDLSSNQNSVGRNKKNVTMDLTRPEGREVFFRLIAKSDVFAENNQPELLDHLGFGTDRLFEANPKLIIMRMPGFGLNGPYSSFRAFGANMEAMMGHALLRGYTDTDPSMISPSFLSDACAGATAATAIMAALIRRRQTGKGELIEMSQAENFVNVLSQAFMDYSMNQRVQHTLANRDPERSPQGVYRCTGEDSWLAVTCNDDSEFEALCLVIGRPELATDIRCADTHLRFENHDALDEAISAWTSHQDHYEAFHTLQRAGVTAAPVLTTAQVFADPHLQARDDWQRVRHPKAGEHWHYKSQIHHMSETPLPIRAHAAVVGEHNEYVYKDVLGYSDAEYQWFVDNLHAGTTFINEPHVGVRE